MTVVVAQFGEKLLLFCYHSFTILACSGVLPQYQNISHLRNILLFCYSTTLLPQYQNRTFLTWEIFCYAGTSVEVCFSSEKHSAILPLLKVLVSAHPHYYYIGWRGGELQLIVLESSLCQISEKFGILDTSHSHKADNVLWKPFSCQHINHIIYL